MPRRPLLLTGGPAVGKSTTARCLADRGPRCAVIDVDDVRQLVRTGGAAPWDGPEGVRQQELGVRNAAALAVNFAAAGIDVVLADVVDDRTLPRYRALLPGVLVVRLGVPFAEARRRAGMRPVFLTDAEFELLHRQQLHPLRVDHELDVADLTLHEQVDAVASIWAATAPAG